MKTPRTDDKLYTASQDRAFDYDAGMPAGDSTKRARPIAMLNITRTITDHIEIGRGNESGMTLGRQIDAQLLKAANEGYMIQTIALEFEPDDWLELARAIRSAN